MIDFRGKGNNWCFEGEVLQFETNLELSSFEGSLFWTSDVDVPDSIAFHNDDVVPKVRRHLLSLKELSFLI